MLSNLLIGDNLKTIIIVIAIIFAVVTILSLMADSEFMRWFFGIPLVVCLVFTGIYSYGQINTYYSAKGGIYGYITDYFKPNQATTELEDGKLITNFTNFNLVLDGEYYSVSKTESIVYELEDEATYILTINDYPCDEIKQVISEEDAFLTYEYNYLFGDYTEDGSIKVKAEDTITITYKILKNEVTITITTNCDGSTSKLWNSYFNKNNFELTLQKVV